MFRQIIASALLALTGSAALAQAPTPPEGREASIPFVRFGQIDDFAADGNRGIYLRDRGRRWYYASILGPCTGLPFAQRIGVVTRGIDRLDRFGTILVDGERCDIDRLVTSDGPPRRHRRERAGNAG